MATNQPEPLSALAFGELGLPDLPRHGVLSVASAARAYGLPLVTRHGRSATLPVGFHARSCEGWTIHRSRLGPDDLTRTGDGFPVTTLRRTVLDCCKFLPFYDGLAILNRELVTLADMQDTARRARGTYSGALKKAVRWCDSRAESAQESVGRVALQQAGMPCEPQFQIPEGRGDHCFDLGLEWAKVVVDLQSQAHHSAWAAVERDIGYLKLVNLTDGWKLALTVPSQVLPNPYQFVHYVMGVIIGQPGLRSRRLRRRYVDECGVLRWPMRAPVTSHLADCVD